MAIVAVETGGKCHAKGASGEGGCFQFMPQTWAYWAKQVYGYVANMTDENELNVALYKIQYHLNEGYTQSQVSLIWNQGHAGTCKAGTNSKGVAYNSCAYQKQVLAMLN